MCCNTPNLYLSHFFFRFPFFSFVYLPFFSTPSISFYLFLFVFTITPYMGISSINFHSLSYFIKFLRIPYLKHVWTCPNFLFLQQAIDTCWGIFGVSNINTYWTQTHRGFWSLCFLGRNYMIWLTNCQWKQLTVGELIEKHCQLRGFWYFKKGKGCTLSRIWCLGHQETANEIKWVGNAFFDYGLYILFHMTAPDVLDTILGPKSWTEHLFPKKDQGISILLDSSGWFLLLTHLKLVWFHLWELFKVLFS